jgi:hypothetical protein
MQADFFVFDLPKNIIDPAKNVIISKFSDAGWDSHNIFLTEHSSISKLKKHLCDTIEQFMIEAQIDDKNNLYILGWLNHLQPGQFIQEHFHSLEKNNFFSCNVSLDDYSTKTSFYVPWIDRYGDIFCVSNENGKSCLFPSWLWHSVENNNSQRFTLGIDFYTEKRMEEYFKNEHNHSPAPIQNAVPL